MASGRFEMDVAPLQQAFLASGRNASEVARELGWTRPDGNRVKRVLGLSNYSQGRGRRRRRRESCSYEMYVEVARAIGVEPADLGA